jgi:cytochrome c peroxidase
VEALKLGLKVDMEKLDLAKFVGHNPLSSGGTKELLKLDAVVGLKATFSADGQRTTQKRYRTTPLRGLAKHPPYFHDGSAKSVEDVVDHYVKVLNLQLTKKQRHDLEEYLKSL